MPHGIAPLASADLDQIWYHIAKESGSIATADRVIESITARFLTLADYPHLGRARDEQLQRSGKGCSCFASSAW